MLLIKRQRIYKLYYDCFRFAATFCGPQRNSCFSAFSWQPQGNRIYAILSNWISGEI